MLNKEERLSEELPRKLGLFDGTLIVIGTIIGSGIFLVPAQIAGKVHSVVLIFLVWIAAGILSFFGALSYSELGAAFPKAGGLYVFIREAFGHLAGFLFGWALFLVINTGSIATLAYAFSIYFGYLFPLSHFWIRIISIIAILLLTAINCLGVRFGAFVQNLFGFLKTFAIFFIVFSAFFIGKGSFSNFLSSSGFISRNILSDFGIAMIAALWAYEGWHLVTFSAGEIKNPRKNLPFSLLLGTLFVIAVYLIANMAYLYILPVDRIIHSEKVASVVMEEIIGPGAGILISVAILISIYGATNGLILTGPRVYYAMAKDRLFFKKAEFIHPKFRTPVYSIILQGIWASFLILIVGGFTELFTYTLFIGWIFYGMGALAVIALRKKMPDLQRPYRTFGYPVVPLLFISGALFLVINTLIREPRNSLLGIFFVLSGFPVYYIWKIKKRKNI
ncbi:MAG: amino acid permease [Acidobacteriota bacterium]